MARGSTSCVLWLHAAFVVAAAQDAADPGLDLLQRSANLKAASIDVYGVNSGTAMRARSKALPSMSLPECQIRVQNREACGSAGITGDECERRGYCWSGDAVRRADQHPRCFCPSEARAELVSSRRATELSVEPALDALTQEAYDRFGFLHDEWQKWQDDQSVNVCEILPIAIANLTEAAFKYAEAFAELNNTDQTVADNAGGIGGNSGYFVTELAHQWMQYQNAESCPYAIVKIAEAGEAISKAWADTMMSFRVLPGAGDSDYGPGTFRFKAAAGVSNTFAWMFTEIAKDWGEVAGNAPCSSVPAWSEKFEKIITAMAGQVGYWAGLMETLGSAMIGPDKAGALSSVSWGTAAVFDEVIAPDDVGVSSLWADTCKSSSKTAAKAASMAVVSAMTNYTMAFKMSTTACAEAFRQCTSDSCLGAMAGAAGGWAWFSGPMSMVEASLPWLTVFSTVHGEVPADALKAWTDFFALIGVEGSAGGLAWSEIARLADIPDGQCGTLISSANSWAYYGQLLGEALRVAGREWSTIVSQADSSQTWSWVLQQGLQGLSTLSNGFATALEGADTETTLGCSASAANTWMYAFSVYVHETELLAVDHADNMDTSQDPPLYLEASDIWTDAMQAAIDVGEEMMLDWTKAFVRPTGAGATSPALGAIQSASDSFAYFLRELSSRTKTSGEAWVCIFCTSGWTEAMDNLLNVTNDTVSGSAANSWTTLSPESVGSWDYTSKEVLKARLLLADA